jgi:hypothetical protein
MTALPAGQAVAQGSPRRLIQCADKVVDMRVVLRTDVIDRRQSPARMRNPMRTSKPQPARTATHEGVRTLFAFRRRAMRMAAHHADRRQTAQSNGKTTIAADGNRRCHRLSDLWRQVHQSLFSLRKSWTDNIQIAVPCHGSRMAGAQC